MPGLPCVSQKLRGDEGLAFSATDQIRIRRAVQAGRDPLAALLFRGAQRLQVLLRRHIDEHGGTDT